MNPLLKSRRTTKSCSHLQNTEKNSVGGETLDNLSLLRKASCGDLKGKTFVISVIQTLQELLKQEDTNGDYQITVDDVGPKVFLLPTLGSGGHKKAEVRGNYAISNLLQELTLADDIGDKCLVLNETRLFQDPVLRLSNTIKHSFWDNLTRCIDEGSIEQVAPDPKDWTKSPVPRIYVPQNAPEQYAYYTKLANERPELNLEVLRVPSGKTPIEFLHTVNDRPGLLALAMEHLREENGEEKCRGLPFIVPGDRFNELYGWDSYVIALGLLTDGRTDLARAMVQHFCFEIQHYGMILNANRSYYLGRSQPPFLTDMALKVYEHIQGQPDALDFLRTAISAAIKEYNEVWMAEPRYDPVTGLSRYRSIGSGVPRETEAGHFEHHLKPYADKHGKPLDEFVKAYNNGEIIEAELDEYFLHDRAIRESGHDTSYRLEGVCADLATVDLNCLLFKYECDIAYAISHFFGGELTMPAEFCAGEKNELGYTERSAIWVDRQNKRKTAIDKYLWNEQTGMYFDYNTVKGKQTSHESATTFWPLWSGVASQDQAAKLVASALPKLECFGGLSSTTEKSRGPIGPDRPARQWDFPYGWPPHQILAWVGLSKYGFKAETERLAYKWLYLITQVYVDFNGVVAEKYDVTSRREAHKVDAEYGNQGTTFKGVSREGFGWMNASYVLGLTFINIHMRRALSALTIWEAFASNMRIDNNQ